MGEKELPDNSVVTLIYYVLRCALVKQTPSHLKFPLPFSGLSLESVFLGRVLYACHTAVPASHERASGPVEFRGVCRPIALPSEAGETTRDKSVHCLPFFWNR